jgi:flagellar basal body-associated protein FliL
MDDDVDKQVPEQLKKTSGGIGTIKLVIIIFGALIFWTILSVVLFRFFVAPSLNPIDPLEKEKIEMAKKAEEEKKKSPDKENEEDMAMTPEKELHYAKTGRITTNPKGSDRFVVINLGIEFRSKNDLEGSTKESPLPEKMVGKIQGVVNGVLGSMTIEELQSRRDSLQSIFKVKLKPVIQSQKDVFLRNIDIIEYILQ